MADLIRETIRRVVWLRPTRKGPVGLWNGEPQAHVGRSRQHLRQSVMRVGDRVFVDTGAWIALALTRDPLHPRASDTRALLASTGARLYTSVSIVVETFTFLDRNTTRTVALAWKDALKLVPRLRVLPCTSRDLEHAWKYFEPSDFHKLSAVDAL